MFNYLSSKSASELIPSVHFVIRVLKHTRLMSSIRQGIANPLDLESSSAEGRLSKQILAEIEKVEQTPIERIDNSRAEEYIHQLADIALAQSKRELASRADAGKILLQELRANSDVPDLPVADEQKKAGRVSKAQLMEAITEESGLMKKQKKARRMSKAQLIEALSEQSGLTKKQADDALRALDHVVSRQLGQYGEAQIPGLVKLTVVTKPAAPERQGLDHFTNQSTVLKAEPARKVVKARILKDLKDNLADESGP